MRLRTWPRVEIVRRRPSRIPTLETMEGRVVLSTVAAPTVVMAATPIAPPAPDPVLIAGQQASPMPQVIPVQPALEAPAPVATNPRVIARDRRIAEHQAARAARLAALHVTNDPLAQDSSSPVSAAGSAGALAATTVWNGYWLTHSKAVANVGFDYGKLAVSPDVSKVGYSYLHAALRGDGKTLSRLGNTQLVQKVSHQFSQLGQSPAVQSLGHKFTSFGRSVSDKFQSIFG